MELNASSEEIILKLQSKEIRPRTSGNRSGGGVWRKQECPVGAEFGGNRSHAQSRTQMFCLFVCFFKQKYFNSGHKMAGEELRIDSKA